MIKRCNEVNIALIAFAIVLHGCLTGSCQKAVDHIVDQTDFNKDPRTFKGIDPRLQIYSSRFTEDTGKAVVDIPQAIGILNPSLQLPPIECNNIKSPWSDATKKKCVMPEDYAAGICYMSRSSLRWYKWIIVDQPWYARHGNDDTKMEQLMYHELGHCILGRDHNDNYIQDEYDNKWPASIMKSSLFEGKQLIYYELHKDYYINELLERNNE